MMLQIQCRLMLRQSLGHSYNVDVQRQVDVLFGYNQINSCRPA